MHKKWLWNLKCFKSHSPSFLSPGRGEQKAAWGISTYSWRQLERAVVEPLWHQVSSWSSPLGHLSSVRAPYCGSRSVILPDLTLSLLPQSHVNFQSQPLTLTNEHLIWVLQLNPHSEIQGPLFFRAVDQIFQPTCYPSKLWDKFRDFLWFWRTAIHWQGWTLLTPEYLVSLCRGWEGSGIEDQCSQKLTSRKAL